MIISFTAFWNFSKLLLVLHLLAFTKFLLRWCAPWWLWWTLFKTSFKTLRKLFISLLQCFATFRNCCLFCTFWFLRSFYSDDAEHGNYGEHCSNHHFRRWAHFVHHIYSVLKLFEIAVCFPHFGFYEVSTLMMRTMVTMVNVVQMIISDLEQTLYITFTVFENYRNYSLICKFWLLRNLYSGDAHHANCGERSSNHHFWNSAHCVYHLYSVLKLSKIAVCFAPFGF